MFSNGIIPVIYVQERVVLFRKKVQKEKSQLGILENDSSSSPASTLITVHRSRIVEDGYRQLANISGNGLKGIIR
jgi:ubiquitin-protein ligase E3 B